MKQSTAMAHLTDLERGAMRQRLRGLLDAMTAAVSELNRLSILTAESPAEHYDAFETTWRDFECLNATINDYFFRFPEEQKRSQLGVNAEKLTALAVRTFILTSLHYYEAMDRRSFLPLGIRGHFQWHLRKIEELERTVQDRETILAAIAQAKEKLQHLLERSTDLESF